MRRYLPIIVAICFGLIVGFVFAEVAIRIIKPSWTSVVRLHKSVESERGKFARYDPLLGWAGKKGVSDDFSAGDTLHSVRQNRYGFRGGEYPFERSKKKRTVVLGDSFVWGFGVEEEEIFSSVMEKNSSKSLEVVNLGVSGYGTDQDYLLWLERGIKWAPDEVILFITLATDPADVLFKVAYGYPKPHFAPDGKGSFILENVPVPKKEDWGDGKATGVMEIEQAPLPRWLLSHSAFFNLVVGAASRNPAMRSYLESSGVLTERRLGNDWEYLIYMTRPTEEVAEAWTTLLGLAGEIKKSVEASGARFRVAAVPTMVQVYPEMWNALIAMPNIPKGIELSPLVPSKIVSRWCKKNGVVEIDLLTPMIEAGKKDPYLYYPLNRHWTASGHVVTAEAISRALVGTK